MMTGMIDLAGYLLIGGSLAAAALFVFVLRFARGGRQIAVGASIALLLATLSAMSERLMPVLGWPMETRASAANILGALACFAAAYSLNAVIKRALWFGILREGDHSAAPSLIMGLGSFALYGLTAMITASAIFHYDVTALAATSGLVAVVLGYSAQSTLSELFAGLALNLSKPFKIGDSVQVDGVWGNIVGAGWRSVSLRTYEGTIVTMPNSKLVSAKVTNLNQPDSTLRHHIPFTVDIDVPPGRVQEVGLAALRRLPHALPSPAPMLLFKNVTEHGMAYEAIFWHDNPNQYILRRDEAGSALWYAFKRAGITFSVQRRLQFPAADAAPKEQDFSTRSDTLRAIMTRQPLYRAFPADSIDHLMEHFKEVLFGPGELVFRQGDPGTSMFVILEGAVDVSLESEHGTRVIYGLGVGDTFGHMSLMTGEPRLASVRAVRHLVVAEIEKSSLEPILQANPEIIHQIAQEIARIESSREALMHAGAETPTTGAAPSDRLLSVLVTRIRGFLLSGDA